MRTFLDVVATFAVALLLGIGSAWYMIDHGSPLTTGRIGPWASWVSEGNPVADPYTKAHLARSGRLPLTSTIARYFVANSDSEGRSAHLGLRIFDRGLCHQRPLVVVGGL